jgi:hypothetical protein
MEYEGKILPVTRLWVDNPQQPTKIVVASRTNTFIYTFPTLNLEQQYESTMTAATFRDPYLLFPVVGDDEKLYVQLIDIHRDVGCLIPLRNPNPEKCHSLTTDLNGIIDVYWLTENKILFTCNTYNNHIWDFSKPLEEMNEYFNRLSSTPQTSQSLQLSSLPKSSRSSKKKHLSKSESEDKHKLPLKSQTTTSTHATTRPKVNQFYVTKQPRLLQRLHSVSQLRNDTITVGPSTFILFSFFDIVI